MQNETKNMNAYEDYRAECYYSDTTPIPFEDFVELYTDENIFLID